MGTALVSKAVIVSISRTHDEALGMQKENSDRWIAPIERALALLATRIDEPPTLDELAASAGVSPYHFHRIWRAMTGETVGQTIGRLRIAASQDRLAVDNASITAVALDGGFATPQSFARAFRRITGISPTQFLLNGNLPINVAPISDVAVRIELRAELKLVALRREGGAYRELNVLFWHLWNWAETTGKLDGMEGIYGIPLDDPVSVAEDQLRYDACLALADTGAPSPPLRIITLAAGEYATLRHTGSYDGLEHTNQLITQWLIASGRNAADFPLFHCFLDDPEEVAPEALRTDILIRLEQEESA
jgi:AraC family transcriptional regulator